MITFNYRVSQNVHYWSVDLLTPIGINAIFYCRAGGFSRGAFQGLNQGFDLGDDHHLVKQNRQLAYQVGKFGPMAPVMVKQIHSNTVLEVDQSHAGQGWLDDKQQLPAADGMITTVPGLPLALKTADCLPILIVDKQGQGIAALHAGWRGLVANIICQGLSQLQALLNKQPEQFLVIMGPCISADHFIVTKELFDHFIPYGDAVIKIQDKSGYVNLPALTRQQLVKQGVPDYNIYQIPGCTYAESDKYYSFRRDQGQTGRMLSMIQINQ